VAVCFWQLVNDVAHMCSNCNFDSTHNLWQPAALGSWQSLVCSLIGFPELSAYRQVAPFGYFHYQSSSRSDVKWTLCVLEGEVWLKNVKSGSVLVTLRCLSRAAILRIRSMGIATILKLEM